MYLMCYNLKVLENILLRAQYYVRSSIFRYSPLDSVYDSSDGCFSINRCNYMPPEENLPHVRDWNYLQKCAQILGENILLCAGMCAIPYVTFYLRNANRLCFFDL